MSGLLIGDPLIKGEVSNRRERVKLLNILQRKETTVNLPDHKTKIVCTIGPASESQKVMANMLQAGMNVARLNFSDDDFSIHKKVIDNLRAASQVTGSRITIMADFPGPKIRIGKLKEEPIELIPGNSLVLTTEDLDGDAQRISVNFKQLPRKVTHGDTLFLDDGLIQVSVVSVEENDIVCEVIVGGELRSCKGVNLPGADLGLSAFTERDKECLKFAATEGLDAISQSFVETGDDIRAVRQAADALNYHPFIIAKIERSNALEHIDDILDAADGIMIARGDLGVEVPIEKIAVIQKDLMRQANRCSKPVITATQMLSSMTNNRQPTRAEATDVANAILDGTDCVMLSGESAMGRYPVDAVEMLAKIAAVTELHRPSIAQNERFQDLDFKAPLRPAHLIALGVKSTLKYVKPAAVFVPTHSGNTARMISSFHLHEWIVAVSSQDSTCQHLQFSSGVHPLHEPQHPENWKEFVKRRLGELGLTGNIVFLTEGPSSKHPETNNRMEIIELGQ
jgi:pyruvate kinase